MIFLSFSRRIPFQIPRKLQRGSPEVQAFSWFQGPGRLADDPQTSNSGRTNATLQYLFKMMKLVRLRVFVNKARGLMKERFQRLTNWRKPHSCSTSDQLELYCCRSALLYHLPLRSGAIPTSPSQNDLLFGLI